MKSRIIIMILAVLFLSACNGTFNVGIEHSPNSTATLAPGAADTLAPGTTNLPTDTLSVVTATLVPSNTPLSATLSAATATKAPSKTPAPTVTNTASNPTTASYIDDRSTPSQVIVSLYNAINRKEYLRAYSYWNDPASSLGSFNSFANGYKDTASVDLTFGQINGDAGMSQVYYTIPVILKVTDKNGVRTNFAACYVVHAAAPGVFGAPPFPPMDIDRGSASPSDINLSNAAALATACNNYPVGPNPVPVSGSTLNIDKNNFLDNRSGPIETVSSLLNALNLKQYVRAYSYFQDPATFPGPYDPYAAGYANTDVINATFGTVQSEGAAGSLYYKVPLAMKVLTTSSSTQTFVGCYTLRLAQPAVQGTPPFQPMGIISGKFNQVDNGTNVNALLPTACN